jgi:hypothetical protein
VSLDDAVGLDQQLLRGAVAAITTGGMHSLMGLKGEARQDIESAIRMLRCALETEASQRELVRRLVTDTEPRLSHEYDTRSSDDGEVRA